MRLTCLALGISLLLMSMRTLWAIDINKVPTQSCEHKLIASLIEQLEHEDFVRREAAERRLLEIGISAIEQIKAATQHYNANIRYRAERLLTILKRRSIDIYLESLEKRIDRFVSDNCDTALPGWESFERIVGDSPQTRQLFADMHRAEPQLMLAYSRSPSDAAAVWPVRVKQRQRERPQYDESRLPTDVVTALLWIALDTDVNLSTSEKQLLSQFLLKQRVADVVQNAAVRELCARWIEHAYSAKEANNLGKEAYGLVVSQLKLAARYGFKREGSSLATKLLKDKSVAPFVHPPIQVPAMLSFLTLGEERHIGAIEPLLEDERVASRFMRKPQAQVRDIALGVMVLLSKQNVAEYNLDSLEELKLDVTKIDLSQLTLFAFKTPQQRKKAIEKWRARAKENLRDEKAVEAEAAK